jgi:DNA-binding response OmpR family regulator
MSTSGHTDRTNLDVTQAPPARASVLLVDDDRVLLVCLAQVLDREGYGVTIASTGAEAIARARQRRYDIVIAELGLPDMPGSELFRQIATTGQDQHPRCILVSSGPLEVETVAASGNGVPVLSKPFSGRDLVELVGRLLARSA